MSELLKISLTAATTIIGGVIIFVVSQLFQKLVIEPVQEQRMAIGLMITAWPIGPGPTPIRAPKGVGSGIRQRTSCVSRHRACSPLQTRFVGGESR